ncbi:MAG: AMP-binding protein [Pseudomonadota bacterium]
MASPERPMLNTLAGTAAAYGIEAGEISYGDALRDVEARARAFQAAGYAAGMRVALLLENRPSYFLTWLALNSLGLSVVPINPELRAAELDYLIGHSEPSLIISIPSRVANLKAVTDTPIVEEGAPLPPPGSAGVVAEQREGAEREAAVLYTSGTTGKPKGCVLSNTYFLMAGDWYNSLDGIVSLRDEGERMITPLPVFHMNAMAASFMGMLSVGGCLTVLDRFHPSTWWDDVRAARATCLHYLGVMPSILMKAPEASNDKVHNVRFGFGAGIDPKLHEPFEERFGFPLCEGWAMTETGLAAHLTNNRDHRLVGASCLGSPTADVDIKLEMEPGRDVGELLVRRTGPEPRKGFFSHYYKDPKATLEAWAGGWFHTGDLVRRDAEGRYFFVDRKKNVIRRSGENIAAVEVESILMKHPAIIAAGVAAVPDEIRGEEVLACLVSDLNAEEIAVWAREQMAYYKVPGYIAFVDELPLTPTQKIQRAELKTLAAKLAPSAHDVRHLKKRRAA